MNEWITSDSPLETIGESVVEEAALLGFGPTGEEARQGTYISPGSHDGIPSRSYLVDSSEGNRFLENEKARHKAENPAIDLVTNEEEL